MPPPKPKVKRERNIYGDFVVTKINIKEREIPVPQNDEEEEEEEESSEEEEEQAPAEQPAEEEVKKEAVKILSKKEQKRLEDEEFERVMNEMGTGGDAPQASQEEAK